MRWSRRVRSVSSLKAHASEMLRELADHGEPLVITRRGVPRAVLQDIVEYEETQETLALLKILARGRQQVEDGRVRPAADVFESVRQSAH